MHEEAAKQHGVFLDAAPAPQQPRPQRMKSTVPRRIPIAGKNAARRAQPEPRPPQAMDGIRKKPVAASRILRGTIGIRKTPLAGPSVANRRGAFINAGPALPEPRTQRATSAIRERKRPLAETMLASPRRPKPRTQRALQREALPNEAANLWMPRLRPETTPTAHEECH